MLGPVELSGLIKKKSDFLMKKLFLDLHFLIPHLSLWGIRMRPLILLPAGFMRSHVNLLTQSYYKQLGVQGFCVCDFMNI